MDSFLRLPPPERRFACQQVEARMGLQAVSVEKNDHVANWRADCREMLGPMFFGEIPTFEQMMAAAAEFEKTFNATA